MSLKTAGPSLAAWSRKRAFVIGACALAACALGTSAASASGTSGYQGPVIFFYPAESGPGLDGYHNTETGQAYVTVTDVGGPGVKTTYYQVDPGGAGASPPTQNWIPFTGSIPLDYQPDGYYQLWAYATDTNGFAGQPAFLNFAIDTTAPTTTISVSPTPTNGMVSPPATVTLTANDNLSGVANSYYSINGGATQTYATPFQIAAPGVYTIDYWSADNAGNVETVHSYQLQVTGFTTITGGGNTTCDDAIVSGTINGNLTVPAGDSCVLSAGTLVTGNVTNYGTLSVDGATINGNLQSSGPLTVQSGSTIGGNLQTQGGTVSVAGPSTTIDGNLQIQGGGPLSLIGNPAAGSTYGITVDGNLQVQQLASSAAVDAVCAIDVAHNLQWQNNAQAVRIGGPNCAGNYVGGNLQVQNNALPSGDSTPAATIEDNTVKGNLQSQQNSPAAVVTGNTVSGDIQTLARATGRTVAARTRTRAKAMHHKGHKR